MQQSKNLQQLDHLSDISELLNSIIFFSLKSTEFTVIICIKENLRFRLLSMFSVSKKFHLCNILIVDTSFLLILEFTINVYGNTKLNFTCSWHGSLCPHLQLVQHFSVSNPWVSVWALWKWDTYKWPYITDYMICLSPHDDFSNGT